jgi:ornithine decarboxylase
MNDHTASPSLAYPGVAALIEALVPREPVYCLYPHVLHRSARRFLDGFPGRVLYAVKANPHGDVLRLLHAAGVCDFDTASLPEIRLVNELCPGATCWFMAPVRFDGAAAEACARYGVRAFVIDHANELERLLRETRGHDITVFVRMQARHEDATYDFSEKFGATPDQTVELLRAVRTAGTTPALAFNIGSLIRNSGAHAGMLAGCADVIGRSGVAVRQLDIGGGFPRNYPGLDVDAPERFFAAIEAARRAQPVLKDVELFCEPGRALAADGMSVLTRVLLRKPDALYLNDGIWGSFLEQFVSHGKVLFPTRVYRGGEPLVGTLRSFTLFGPTCDSLDRFPAPFPLPEAIRAGDFIEFGMTGAYSVSNRSHFNGFYPDTFATITDPVSLPPGVE